MATPSIVVLDQKYPFSVLHNRGDIELRITAQHTGDKPIADLEFWITVDFITKLSWHFPVSEATSKTFPLAAGVSLVIDLANWAQTEHQLSFDLVLKVQTPIPFVPAIQVYRGGVHIALPNAAETSAITTAQAPTSADQLGQIIAAVKSASTNGVPEPSVA